MKLVLAAAGTLLLTCAVVEVIRSVAVARQMLDVPNERSSHAVPTPRLGGAAFVLIITALGLAMLGASAVLFLLALALAAVSIVDDLAGLPPLWRLSAHAVLAIAVVVVEGPATSVFLADGLAPGIPVALGWVLPAVWIVGFVNAFNFMDGSDGIAGLQAVVALLGWGGLLGALAAPTPAAFAVLAAASVAGFLVHNWSPARIFMGDGGSAYLGFLLAVFPWLTATPERFLLTAVFLVWPFAFDAAFTLLARASRRANVLRAHREHLYQRLLRLDYSHRAVALLYALMATVTAACGVSLTLVPTRSLLVTTVVVTGTMSVALVAVVRRLEKHAVGLRAGSAHAQ